jgi:hypothetical protein
MLTYLNIKCLGNHSHEECEGEDWKGTAASASGVRDSACAAAAATRIATITPKAAPTASSGVQYSATGEVGSLSTSDATPIATTTPKAAPIAASGVQYSASGEVGSPLMSAIVAPTAKAASTAASGVRYSESGEIDLPLMSAIVAPTPEATPAEQSGVQYSAGEVVPSVIPLMPESATPGSPGGKGQSRKVVTIAPEITTEFVEPEPMDVSSSCDSYPEGAGHAEWSSRFCDHGWITNDGCAGCR